MNDDINKDDPVKVYPIRMCDVPGWAYTAFKNEGKVLLDKEDVEDALGWLAFLDRTIGYKGAGKLFNRIQDQIKRIQDQG